MKGKIFNAQEVQAIIAGKKTMFREVCKVQPKFTGQSLLFAESSTDIKQRNKYSWANVDEKLNITHRTEYFKPKFQVGQEIFVKEVFCKSIFGKAIYKDEEKEIRGFGGKEVVVKWKPAHHMKQEHSRLTLEITNIKMERLQDISEEDARLEGFPVDHLGNYYEPSKLDPWQGYARASFSLSWNPTHKKPEEKFYANPFVWVVNFKVNK